MVVLFLKPEFCSLDDIIPFNKHMDPFQVLIVVAFIILGYLSCFVGLCLFNFQEVRFAPTGLCS
jgi:hypothetical protein